MNLHGSAISFPFAVDDRGTFVTSADRHEIIGQAIADIIETRKGERVMLPDYGIPDFVFDVQNFSFAARLAYMVGEQIRRYVPLVRSVEVDSDTDEEGRAIVNIKYTEVGEINAPRNLVFPVWRLRNGTI